MRIRIQNTVNLWSWVSLEAQLKQIILILLIKYFNILLEGALLPIPAHSSCLLCSTELFLYQVHKNSVMWCDVHKFYSPHTRNELWQVWVELLPTVVCRMKSSTPANVTGPVPDPTPRQPGLPRRLRLGFDWTPCRHLAGFPQDVELDARSRLNPCRGKENTQSSQCSLEEYTSSSWGIPRCS